MGGEGRAKVSLSALPQALVASRGPVLAMVVLSTVRLVKASTGLGDFSAR